MAIVIVSKSSIEGDRLQLSARDSYHLNTVLRLQIADQIICKDEFGTIYKCKIIESDPKNVCVEILDTTPRAPDNITPLTLVIPLLKNSRSEFIIQKGTELGTAQFIIYDFDRSVVKINSEKISSRVKRLEKIAADACKQSTRSIYPEILFSGSNPESLIPFLSQNQLRIIPATENGIARLPLSQILQSNAKSKESICGIVGPEGGFSHNELTNFIEQLDFSPVSLGDLIQRSETAAISVSVLCANLPLKQ